MKILFCLGAIALLQVHAQTPKQPPKGTVPPIISIPCDKEFKICFDGMPMAYMTLNSSSITMQELNDGCKKLEKTRTCVQGFVKKCHKDVTNMWTAVISGLQYICDQPREEVLASMQCTLGDKANLQKCMRDMIKQSTEYLPEAHPGSTDDRKNDMCKSIDSVEKCMEDVEKHDCGKKAAELFSNFYTITNSGMNESMGCDETNSGPVEDECQTEVMQCLSDLMQDGNLIGMNKLDAVSLQKSCDLFEKAEECINVLEDKCSSDVMTSWSSVNDSMGYVCNLPRSDVLAHMSCLDDHKSDVDQCMNKLLSHTTNIISQNPKDRKKICKQMKGLENCVEVVEEKDCSQDATTFYKEFFKRLHQNMDLCDECSGDKITQCFGDLMKDGNFVGMYKVDAESLEKSCSSFKKAKECMWTLQKDCESDIVGSWQSMESSMNYVCSLPRKEVLTHMNCLNNHKSDVDKCMGKLLSHSTNIITDDPKDRAKICGEMKKMENCVEVVEEKECSKDAHLFYKEFFKRMHSSMDLCDCTPEDYQTCFKSVPKAFLEKEMNTITLKQFNDGCLALVEVEQCVEKFTDMCHEDDQSRWTATLNALQYLCDQPRQEVLASIQCTLKDKANLQKCMKDAFTLHQPQPGKMTESKDNICSAHGDTEKCMENVEKHDCGQKALKIFKEFYRRISEPVNAMECTIVNDKCQPDEFTRCFAGFMNNGKFVPFVDYTKETLDEKCKIFETTKSCVYKFESECQASITATWNSLRSAFHYICAQPREDMEKYSKCLNNHQTDLGECMSKMISSHADILKNDQNPDVESASEIEGEETRQNQLCSMMDNMEECVVKIEKEECGKNAARIYKEFFALINKASKDMCPSENECESDSHMKCFKNKALGFIKEDMKTLTIKQLNLACKTLEDIKICVMDFDINCHKDITSMWQTTLAGLEYLCEQPRQDVLANVQCTLGDKANLMKCVNNTIQQSSRFLKKEHPGTDDERKEAMCSSISKTENCMEEVEEHDCGKNAAEMFRGFFQRMQETMQERMTCEGFCNRHTMFECLSDLMSDGKLITLTNFDATSLEKTCEDFEKADNCIFKFEKECNEHITSFWKSMRSGILFLCSEPRNEVVAHMACLNDHDSDVAKCINKLTSHTHKPIEGSEKDFDQEKICKERKNMENCVEVVEEKECSEEASLFYQQFFQKMNGDCAQDSECSTDQFKDCFAGFTKDGNFVGFTQFTRAELDKNCKLFEETNGCVWQFESKCSKSRSAMWNGLRNAFHFICVQPREDVVKYSKCLKDHNRDMGSCMQRTMGKQAQFLQGKVTEKCMNEDVKQADTCKVMGTLQDCVLEVEEHDCGKKGQEMYQKFFDYVNKATEKLCAEESGESSSVDSGSKDDDDDDSNEEQCDTEAHTECLQGITNGKGDFPEITAENIDTLCKKYDEARECVREFETYCKEDVATMWSSLNSLFQFVCTHNRTQMKKFATCNHDHQQDFSVCMKKVLDHQMDHLEKSKEQDLKPEMKAEMCKKSSELKDCVVNVENHDCGEGARKLFKQFYASVMKNMINNQFCSCVGPIAGLCKPDNFQQCLGDTTQFMNLLSDKKYSVRDFNEYCSDMENAEKCIANFEQHCHTDVTKLWKSMLAGVKYLCNQDHNKVVQYMTCLKENKPEFTECMKATMNLQNNILQTGHKGTDSERKMDMCKSVRAVEQCVEKTENHSCGKEAGAIFTKMFEAMDEVMLTSGDCAAPNIGEDIVCHQSNFRKCFNERSVKVDLLSGETTTKEEVESYCESMRELEECTADFQDECSINVRGYLLAFSHALKKICKIDSETVAKSINCLAKHNEDLGECIRGDITKHREFLENKNGKQNAEFEKDMCQAIKDSEACMKKIEDKFCADGDKNVIYDYFRSYNKQLRKYTECDVPEVIVPGESNIKKLVIGASVGGAVALLIIIAVVLACVYKCRRRSVKNDFGDSSNQMPSNLKYVLQQNEKAVSLKNEKGTEN